MANSFFFTNPYLVDSQSPNDAFGPVVGNEASQFRITSKFSSTTDIPAYAAFSAQVFLQPSTESDKVNLILRPYKQPIKGLAIKYFVYRGLKKTDFIPSGNEDIVPYGQKGNASGFIKLLWEQLEAFNDEAINNAFKAKWIGYDPTNQAADTIIDDYFFMADAYGDDDNESLKPFELPIIPIGTHLGNFKGNFGLDVVLSDGDYKSLSSNTGFKFDLAYARANESIINTASIPAGYAEKQYKEAVLDFLDPASFYGLHVSDGTVKINNGSGVEILKTTQIYEQAISKFATKNRVYIHILGHLGRSYNYYGSYDEVIENSDVIKLGITAEEISPIDYGTDSWPMIIQEVSQSHDNDVNTLLMKLAYSNESKPLLFGQVATMSSKAEKNFLTEKQLIPTITDVPEDEEFTPYTNAIELFVPAVGDSGNKLNVASFIKLLYKGTILEVTDAATGIAQVVKPIDALFGPVNIEQRLASASDEVISWCFDNNYQLSNITKVISDNENKISTQTKIIFDKHTFTDNDNEQVQDRVIYETYLIEGIGESILNGGSSISSSISAGNTPFSKETNNYYRLNDSYTFKIELLTDGQQVVSGLRLFNTIDSNFLNKFVMGLQKEENDILKNKIQENNLKNSSLFLTTLFDVETSEINGFHKYYVQIIGETVEGILKIYSPDSEIVVYSLDKFYFFSKKYSDYMIEENIDLELDLTIDFTL